MSFVGAAAASGTRRVERSACAEVISAQKGAVANAVKKIGLPIFKGDQATEDVKHVHQFRGVHGHPTVGLNFFEQRRRSPVAGRR